MMSNLYNAYAYKALSMMSALSNVSNKYWFLL